jgi:non-ribosomal peptide synthetase component E (peptide arylation enzyme)
LNDVIISGGENISSVEVEGILLTHPAVQEVRLWACLMKNGARLRMHMSFSGTRWT